MAAAKVFVEAYLGYNETMRTRAGQRELCSDGFGRCTTTLGVIAPGMS